MFFIILSIHNIINLQKYNYNGFVIDSDIQDKGLILANINNKNPLLIFDSINNYDIQNKYIYIDELKNYKNGINDYHYKNKKLFPMIINKKNIFDYTILEKKYSIIPSYSISIFYGKTSIQLKQCIHKYNVIGVIDGEASIYLFNPKHKNDIIFKNKDEIKKWGHKKIIKKNHVLIIPPYWYYIQEVNDKIIQYHIDIDSVFTLLPNLLKEHYSYLSL